jgi:putative endonuclease
VALSLRRAAKNPAGPVILSAAKNLGGPATAESSGESGRHCQPIHILMRSMRESAVYMMANGSRTLYVGVTSDLERRVYQHKHKLIKGFTSKYNITKPVWYESFPDIEQAIEGEKRLKGWLRSKKVALIESQNPNWEDLSERWFGGQDSSLRSE